MAPTDADLLRLLTALGAEYVIVGDAQGNARVNIGNDGPVVAPLAEAIRQAIERHLKSYPGNSD